MFGATALLCPTGFQPTTTRAFAPATHPLAMKTSKPVFKLMAKDEPDTIAGDGALAGHPLAQRRVQAGTPGKALRHPISLVRHACGLEQPPMTRIAPDHR